MVTVANGVTQTPPPPLYSHTLVYNRNVLLAKPVQIRETAASDATGDCEAELGEEDKRQRESGVNMRSLRVSAC